MSDTPIDSSKRTWIITSACAGAVGGVAAAVPFVSSFQPSERAKAAGAAVEVDISALKPGEKITVEWRGKPVWIIKRTPEQLAIAQAQTESQLADPKSDRNPAEFTPDTPRTSTARSSLKCLWRGYLPAPGLLALGEVQNGSAASLPDDWQGGFLCPAMVPRLTWPVACSRTSPRPTTSKCRRTCISRIRVCSSATTRKPEEHHGPIQGNLSQRFGGRQAHQLV
jgi:ubiquinol-cytochrome c reductase iron-sulfur subunit